MKRIVLLLVAIFCVVLLPVGYTYCVNSTPHVVVNGEVWLQNENGERLFLLPDGYYAKIVNLDDSYYYVTFNGVVGKISKNTVSTIGYHTVARGTEEELYIAEEYSEFVSINLKVLPDLSSETAVALPTTESFTFIGSYPTSEGIWYYVKYNDIFGYVKQERTTMKTLNIPEFVPETPPIDDITTTADADEKNSSVLDDKTLRIIIIVGLSIPAVLIVVLLFKPRRATKRYDDNKPSEA